MKAFYTHNTHSSVELAVQSVHTHKSVKQNRESGKRRKQIQTTGFGTIFCNSMKEKQPFQQMTCIGQNLNFLPYAKINSKWVTNFKRQKYKTVKKNNGRKSLRSRAKEFLHVISNALLK